MNYFKILNQFWRWQATHEISYAEAFLYFAILNYANSTHWKRPFHIPNNTLMRICNFDRKQLTRYRNQLITKGLIQYSNGTRWNAGNYDVCSLFSDNHSFDGTQNSTQDGTQKGTQSGTQDGHIYNIKNKNKNKIKKEYAPFVRMTESQYQLLVQEYGEPSAQRMIEELNWYKESSGKEYFSDYAAIKGWVHKRVQAQKPKSAPDTTLMVYQDDYDHEQLERIARQNAMKQR